MGAAERERKYSTGFRLFVGGWAIVGLGVILSTQVWEPLGAICVVGVFPAVWFRGPSDWRKTWPDDFPTVARLFRRQIQMRAGAEEPRNWWTTAPATSRRRFALFTTVGGAGLFIWGATQPTNYHGYPSHSEAFVLGPMIAFFGLSQFRRANSDR